MMELPVMLCPAQACELLQCSRKTLDRLMRSGDLRYVKLGRGRSSPIRIPRDALLRLAGLESGRGQTRRAQAAEAEYHAAMASIRGAR